MKVFLLYGDLVGPGPVWRNGAWAQFNALSDCFDATYLGAPWNDEGGHRRLGRLLRPLRSAPAWAEALCEKVRAEHDPDGPNILIHLVNRSAMVAWSQHLQPVWSLFTHRVMYVVDTLQPDHVDPAIAKRYDLIASWCQDLSATFEAAFCVPTIYWPSHTDVLNFHSMREARPIDLIVVGRRDGHLHSPLHRHFNDPSRDRLFLDFVTRTQGEMGAEQEFRLLAATMTRAAAAFCFEASDRPRFMGRSPFMVRWIYAWMAGCTVFGSRPTGPGAQSQMDWEESMFDLPSDPGAAIACIEGVLSDRDGLARRRRINVIESLRRHDTRHRMCDLLGRLGLDVPERLQAGLDRLSARIAELADGSRDGGRPTLSGDRA